jgi:hypothetical protein
LFVYDMLIVSLSLFRSHLLRLNSFLIFSYLVFFKSISYIKIMMQIHEVNP